MHQRHGFGDFEGMLGPPIIY